MAASYLESIETHFLSAIRKGLALRPADVDVIRDWEKRGVPLDVVQRGISTGIRNFLASAEPHTPVPAALRYYRKAVEDEYQAWQRAMAQGRAPVGTARRDTAGPDLRTRARAWLCDARDGAAEDRVRAVFHEALERLGAIQEGTPLAGALTELDDFLAARLVAVAAPDAREAVEAEVRDAAARARARGVGPAAMADVQRAALAAAAAEHLGFQSLVDAVL